MPVDFPLDQIFVNTFRGHPLQDMAWLYYVSAGDRNLSHQYLRDGGGSTLFETHTFKSVGQLVNMWKQIVRKFLFITPPELARFIASLFDILDWMHLPSGPLGGLTTEQKQNWRIFTEPNGVEAGRWVDKIFTTIRTQFRTSFESDKYTNQTQFDGFIGAKDFFVKIVKPYIEKWDRFDAGTLGNLMGTTFGETATEQGYNKNALIPLLLEPVSACATHFYKSGNLVPFLDNFDKNLGKFANNIYDVSFYVKQFVKPNERMNMPVDLLSESDFFAGGDLITELINSEKMQVKKQDIITLFAFAGFDPPRMMTKALKEYAGELTKDIDADLGKSIGRLSDTFLRNKTFNKRATMMRRNHSFILAYLKPGSELQRKTRVQMHARPEPSRLRQQAAKREKLKQQGDVVSYTSEIIVGIAAFIGIFLYVR